MVVLVLDDNLLSSTPIVSQLRQSGHQPIASRGHPEALAAAAAQHPGIIIVNLAAHAFDPFEFIRAIRADPGLHSSRLVGFCGHLEEARQARARDAGCDYVITNAQALRGLATTLATLL